MTRGSLSRGSLSRGSLSRGLSVQGDVCPGGLCPGGLCPGGSLLGNPLPPSYGNERAVRILLECIIVYSDDLDENIHRNLQGFRFQDNNANLLQYLVKVYTRDYEEDAGRNEASFRFPDPTLMFQAAQTSFIDLDHELTQLQHQLNTHGKKVSKQI